MHSLSIEIAPNQFLNPNQTFDCVSTGMPMQDPLQMDNVSFMSAYPSTASNSGSIFSDRRQFEPNHFVPAESCYKDTTDYRSKPFLQNTCSSNLYCRRQKITGTFPDFIDTDNIQSDMGSTGFETSTRRVKPEVKSEFDSCSRISNKELESGKQAEFSDNQDDLFDVSTDILNGAFDTDVYSNMLQRITDCQLPEAQEKDKALIPNSLASTSQFAELKPIRTAEAKPKPYQEALLATAPKNIEAQFARSYDYMTNMSETSSLIKNSLVHQQSQFFLPDLESSFQASSEYDSRFKTGQDDRALAPPKSGQQPYCNHSINITLRYK